MKNKLSTQDLTYFFAFALSLTDDYINQPKFQNKTAAFFEMPSGATLVLMGDVQKTLRELMANPLEVGKDIITNNFTLSFN